MKNAKRVIVFLLAALLPVSLLWSAGKEESPEPAATPADQETAGKYREAPMLAELVKAGKLPPIEERLPKEPAVVRPLGEIGKYGGTLSRGMLGDDYFAYYRLNYDPVLRFQAPNGGKIVANIARDWTVSPDSQTSFTEKASRTCGNCPMWSAWGCVPIRRSISVTPTDTR